MIADKLVRQTVEIFRKLVHGVEVPCLLACSECCSDSPVMTYLEWQMIPKTALLLPRMSPCIFLDRLGKCSIYQHRPTLCRAYGTIMYGLMACCRGAVPKKPVDSASFNHMLMEYSKILSMEMMEILIVPPNEDRRAWFEYVTTCRAGNMVFQGAQMMFEELKRRINDNP